VWREGMVDVLSTNLDGTAGLRAIDSRTVLARWRETVEGPAAPDLATALEVARRAGAKYALVGNVVSSGSDMRVGAEIYSVPDGASLGAAQVEGSPDSIFGLVDRLSIEALSAIWQGEQDPGATPDLARTTTTSLPALKAFLEGESLLRRSDFPAAIAAYQRAIAADSTFAFALYHLAQAYGWSPEVEVRITGGQYYTRAARNAGRLTEREAMLVRAGDAFWKGEIEGIELLQEAVRKYPDEAEAWYNLGEFYFHFGEQALVGRARSDEPFLKAVELDPSFAPFYIHLVNNAFHDADSARARSFIQAYRRAAPNTSFDEENRIAFGLVFGDSSSRREARAALDTLSAPVLGSLAAGYLNHPRFWDEQEMVLTLHPRPRSLQGVLTTVRLFRNSLHQGKLRTALGYLEDPVAPDLTDAGLYQLYATGVPVSAEDLDRELVLDPRESLPPDSLPDLSTFYAGAYAADRSRWDEHAAAVARLRSQSQRFLAQGDSAAAEFAAAAAEGLDGLALWRRGEAERALPLLQLAQTEATGEGPLAGVNVALRWWLGTLHLESGRPREAIRYFESFWHDPLAAYALGRAYEEAGEYAKARQSYEFLASAWKDADPQLQPRVTAARAAAQRLTSVIRE
ncbi:MAG: tetratricopeptide repeat protein, partial [Gemmatimonadota bacterium]